MKCEFFEELKANITTLLQKASLITMPPMLPFRYHKNEFNIIQDTIKKCIAETEDKINKIKQSNNTMYAKIHEITLSIGLEPLKLKKAGNLLIESEILETHYKEMRLLFEEKKFKTEILTKEIEKFSKEIGSLEDEKEEVFNNLIDKIDYLENRLVSLRNKKIELERSKVIKINEILNYMKILEKKDYDEIETKIISGEDVKLHEIQQKHKELVDEYNDKSKRLKELQKDIRKLRKYFDELDLKRENINEANINDSFCSVNDTLLQNDNYNINDSLNNKNIERAESVLKELQEKKKLLFKRIFKLKSEELKEMYEIFKMPYKEYQESEENLEKIESQIHDLIPKKDSFLMILNLIEKRDNLKNAMIDFERIASDPKRLFKNSIQLLNEERFRKTAAPNLLKLEKEILEKIESYENEFGVFYLNGNYKNNLNDEINNRIINKSIFIMGGFDSPRKKRK